MWDCVGLLGVRSSAHAGERNCPKENGWRPIAELRPGHYAVGLLHDGHEVDIFRAGNQLLNVVTGAKIDNAVSWQPREFVTERPISPKLKEEGF